MEQAEQRRRSWARLRTSRCASVGLRSRRGEPARAISGRKCRSRLAYDKNVEWALSRRWSSSRSPSSSSITHSGSVTFEAIAEALAARNSQCAECLNKARCDRAAGNPVDCDSVAAMAKAVAMQARQVPQAASVRGDYASACRFVRHLPPRIAHACVRVDRDPIEETQVHFGYAGLLRDPANDTLREAWGR